MKRTGSLALVVLLSTLVATSCDRPQQEHTSVPTKTCRLGETSVEARCARVDVPEARSSAITSSRRLSLRVVVVPALATAPAKDPLFVLAGGPGQSAVEIAPYVLPMFERVRRRHDIVFVDQRGTGDSHPLRCDGSEGPWTDPFSTQSIREPLTRCLATLDADPRAYTTPAAADDLEDVRKALGYGEINLWGASYGTRLALVYARQYPSSTRTVTLDGVAPVDMKLPATLAEDAQRSLDGVLDGCARDPSCTSRFPDTRAQLASLLDKAAPKLSASDLARLTVGQPTLDHDAIAGGLRALLYRAESAAMIPFIIDALARERDHRALVTSITSAVKSIGASMSEGLFFSVICAEDAPGLTNAELDRRAAGSFLGSSVARSIVEGCEVWPRGDLPAGYFDPITSNVPVLILSGEHDPATPPAHAERVARTLPKSIHAIFPWVGHGASSVGCAPRLIAQLIDTGTTDRLDVSCARKVPPVPFVTSVQGAPP